MKRVLLFLIFGPLIGVASIVCLMFIASLFSEGDVGLRNVGGVIFFMFLFSHVYGSVPAILTGLLSLKYNSFVIKDTAILIGFAVSVSCLFHYFILHRQLQDLLDVSVLPSAISTLILSYLLRTNKSQNEV